MQEMHDKYELYLNSRQVSISIAGIMLLCFFVFIAGYFLGQKKVLEKFSNKIEQDSLADKISSSLYGMYDNQEESLESSDTVDSEDDITVEQEASRNPSAESVVAPIKNNDIVASQEKVVQKPAQRYYAELVGFGALATAQAFVNRLAAKGMDVSVKKRESKTARGKTIYWYQVVTPTYDSHATLVSLVDMIKRDERLKGVRIVTC